MNPKTILLVDDERPILKAFQRIFMDTDYEILTANSAMEALGLLTSNKVHMIISDMRMPEMDGYELLEKVKLLYPSIIRIILSGYSDETVVLRALQRNLAKLYMFKPWKNEELIELIAHIFESEELLCQANLLTLINNTEDLPTIKNNYRRILQLIESEADVGKITKAIEGDASIAAKILQVANSAYFGVKTGSLKQAITFIGLENTKRLVLSNSVIDTMEEGGALGSCMDLVWKHSFLSNRLLAFFYQKVGGKRIPDEYSTVGLLLNVGLIFFIKYFQSDYQKLRMRTYESKSDYISSEQDIFPASHPEVGAYLLNWWEFPFPMVEATLYHNTPFHKSIINHELVCYAHLASHYASILMQITPIFLMMKRYWNHFLYQKFQ